MHPFQQLRVRARAAFERMALGHTNVPLPAPEARLPGSDSPSAIEPLGGGPPRRTPGLVPNDTPLKEWVRGRVASVTDQLAGRREGSIPRYNRPGGFSGPGPAGNQPARNSSPSSPR